MKKTAILVFLVLITTGAFAQSWMSAGGGVLLNYSFNNGLKHDDGKIGYNILSFSGFGFFDAKYAEADIGFAYGSVNYYAKGGSGTGNAGSMMQLNLSLLGKYPIYIGAITIFPLLGVDYNFVLAYINADGNKVNSAGKLFNQSALLLGLGLDYDLANSLYLRCEALFYFRTYFKYWDDNDVIDTYILLYGNHETTQSMGTQIKLAIGYRF